MNLDVISLSSTGLLMMLFGYFGYILKDMPNFLWMLVRQHTISIMQVNTGFGRTQYYALLSFLVDRYELFQCHISYEGWDISKRKIAEGTFYLLDRETRCLIIVNHSKVNNMNNIEYDLIYSIIGTSSNRSKLMNILTEYMKQHLPDKEHNLLLYQGPNSRICHIAKRGMDTLYNSHIDEIKHLLDQFKANKPLYDKLGIVYKTGFIFYGPPGTGKSSLARIIASYMNYDIVYINSKSPQDALIGIPERCVILLEDIDCIITDNREETESNLKDSQFTVNMHSLLNIIDGVLSPSNVIFIATTNYIDKINPALKRPGRFDHSFEIGYLNQDEILQFCQTYNISYASVKDQITEPITGAKLQKILMSECFKK